MLKFHHGFLPYCIGMLLRSSSSESEFSVGTLLTGWLESKSTSPKFDNLIKLCSVLLQ